MYPSPVPRIICQSTKPCSLLVNRAGSQDVVRQCVLSSQFPQHVLVEYTADCSGDVYTTTSRAMLRRPLVGMRDTCGHDGRRGSYIFVVSLCSDSTA